MSTEAIATRRSLRTKNNVGKRQSLIIVQKVGNFLLTIMAVIGTVILIGTIATAFNIIVPLIVTSNSMAPTFFAGDEIISRPVAITEIALGDIVTSPRADGILVTHRVVDIVVTDSKPSLILRGDANNAKDTTPYTSQEVYIPVVIIPNIGWFVATLSNSKFIAAGIFATIVCIGVMWSPGSRKKKTSSK